MDRGGATAELYRAFAEETAAESPCYADWAARIADDGDLLRWIARLPDAKRQPNLVLAAARLAGVPTPGPFDGLRRALLTDDGTIEATIRTRSTQTNEVGRLAVLMPLLAELAAAGRPLALVELGASAGLCLLPDRYRYEWPPTGATVGTGPLLSTEVAGPMPIPAAVPSVSWRSGTDLNPLDVDDPADAAWLRALVWPEQHDRVRRLDAAIEVTRQRPPRLIRGDLFDTLEPEIEQASAHGRVVVLHSAVIAYLEPDDRLRFERTMRHLVTRGVCDWVSNEGEHVLPAITATAATRGRPAERFVLGLNGRAAAWAHGHGASLTWIR